MLMNRPSFLSGGPFRTTRLRAPSLVPNGRIVQQTLVVDAARQQNAAATEIKDESKNVRRRETIFGPDVGEDDEPGWTGGEEGAKVSVDVVKGWVEKAKAEEVSIFVLFWDILSVLVHGSVLIYRLRVYTPPPLYKPLSI